MFRVGQRVVCVNAENGFGNGETVNLVKGRFYEVRQIVSGYINVGGLECYCPSRFRPIVERKTSIECFKAMLNPSKVDA